MLFYSLDDKTQEKVAGKNKKIFKACQSHFFLLPLRCQFLDKEIKEIKTYTKESFLTSKESRLWH